jgi:hypothetical protein
MNLKLDYDILKILISSPNKALEFCAFYDKNMFLAPVRDEAGMVIEYVKNFRTVPTKRTFLEHFAKSPEQIDPLSLFWDNVASVKYDANEYSFDLDKLKKRYKLRVVEALKKSLATNNDTDDILHEMKLRVSQAEQVDSGRAYIQRSAGDYIEEFETSYEARKINDAAKLNIKTGYSLIDWATDGLLPSELFLVGAATGGGKSVMLNNMAVNMWRQNNSIYNLDFQKGHSVLYFSLEMPYADCFDRFLACLADVPQRALTQGKLDVYEEEKVNQAKLFIKEYQKAGYHYQIVDVPRGLTATQIELRFEEACLTFRPEIVVVDYLGLMHVDSKDADWLKLATAAGQLHEIARNYNIVMLSAVQLTDIKRQNNDKKETDRVGTHRIGRSSLILHHANFAMQIEARENERQLPDLPLHWIKNRRGPMASNNLIKCFENARILDTPFTDITRNPAEATEHNVQELIKELRA